MEFHFLGTNSLNNASFYIFRDIYEIKNGKNKEVYLNCFIYNSYNKYSSGMKNLEKNRKRLKLYNFFFQIYRTMLHEKN